MSEEHTHFGLLTAKDDGQVWFNGRPYRHIDCRLGVSCPQEIAIDLVREFVETNPFDDEQGYCHDGSCKGNYITKRRHSASCLWVRAEVFLASLDASLSSAVSRTGERSPVDASGAVNPSSKLRRDVALPVPKVGDNPPQIVYVDPDTICGAYRPERSSRTVCGIARTVKFPAAAHTGRHDFNVAVDGFSPETKYRVFRKLRKSKSSSEPGFVQR